MSGDEIVQGLGPHDVVAPGAFRNQPKKVDLVIHENGRKKVIGEAVVDTDGTYLDITGVVTDDNYRVLITGNSSISLSVGPDGASVVTNYRPEFKAQMPVPRVPLEEG